MPHGSAGFRLVLCVILVSLGGCGGHPDGVLRPVVTAPITADRIDMLVATTRAAGGERGVDFTGERGDRMSLANIVVSIPPGHAVGQVQWPRALPGDPRRDFVTTLAEPLPRQDVPAWFSRASKKSHRVFVFVHGFNTRFDSAVFRFAQIAHDTDASAAPVLFTWPSRGRLLDYNYDRESANFSRSDLAYVLATAAANPTVSEVTLLAHSMGCWIAVEALRQMALGPRGIPAKIDNVILASPDLDIDVFQRQLEEIGPRRPAIPCSPPRRTAPSASRASSPDASRASAASTSPRRTIARNSPASPS
jgi:esterase/lipase superfamily enzyme